MLCLLTFAAEAMDHNLKFDSFEDELEEEALDHMDIGDMASFEFFHGFIDKAIALSDNSEELLEDKALDFSRNELRFTDVSPYVYEAILQDMTLYEAQARRMMHRGSMPEMDHPANFAIWRAIRPMSHVFSTGPNELYKNGKINQT